MDFISNECTPHTREVPVHNLADDISELMAGVEKLRLRGFDRLAEDFVSACPAGVCSNGCS